jgi:hypothetical protein
MRKVKMTTEAEATAAKEANVFRKITEVFDHANVMIMVIGSEDCCQMIMENMEKLAKAFNLDQTTEAKSFEEGLWKLGNNMKNIPDLSGLDCHLKVENIIASLDEVYYPEDFPENILDKRKKNLLDYCLNNVLKKFKEEEKNYLRKKSLLVTSCQAN